MAHMLSRLRRPAQIFFLLLALLFMALLVESHWSELRSHTWRLRPGWLALSALFMAAGWLLEVAIWRRLLGGVGGKLSFGMAFRIWYISAIVRYIPGNVWQPLGMTLLARREGVRVEMTITSIALYQVVNLLSVAAIAAVYFPLTHNLGLLQSLSIVHLDWLIGLGAIPVVVFVARPQWLISILNWLLSKIGRSPLPVELSSRELLWALLVATGTWVMMGLAFLTLTMAITDLPVSSVPVLAPHLIAAYPVAYAIGYLSFITPSGLAVREGALVLLLTTVMGGELIVVAALAMRLWMLFGELFAAGLSLATWPGGWRRRRINDPGAATAAEAQTSESTQSGAKATAVEGPVAGTALDGETI